MEWHLPTFDECMDIVSKCDVFMHKVETVNGYEVHQFSYRLAGYTSFEEHNAYELRGLTFIMDDAGVPKRFLMLHKFFNHNQCGGHRVDVLELNIGGVVITCDDDTIFETRNRGNVMAKYLNEDDDIIIPNHLKESIL